MDFTKATNQQLYEIAMNPEERMIDRYAAASELQRRKKNKESAQQADITKDENRWF